MKNKIKFLFLAIMCAVVVIVSCRKTNSNAVLSIPELSTQLQSSQVFNRYMLFTTRIKRGVLADKYNLTKATQEKLKAIWSENKKQTMANMAQSFTTAGVDNAKEFVFLNINAQRYHNLLLHDFPQLRNMPAKDAVALMHKIYFDIEGNQAHEPSIKDLFAERLLNQEKRGLLNSGDKKRTLDILDGACYSACATPCAKAYDDVLLSAEETFATVWFACQEDWDKEYNAAETYEDEVAANDKFNLCEGDALLAYNTAIVDAIGTRTSCEAGCISQCTIPEN
ncbi:hypothetical protein KXQ82_09540 [Mucilaginibacter sp. HMF5004]|uniref:hypothetical protein n=1 Tax=Mucilaginibacter rivuli TaxID=2857527 RepID=UPI001C5DD006|nr:hypothetical protein [Mucilaginibacter rivuli]MBW4889959.1 hypothetical protein [Mucilaginibacter rivuli]